MIERVADALSPVLAAGNTILLGLSGGVDSVVLFHLLHQLLPRYSCHLSALHVHHGISPHADDWAAFCSGLCARHEIPFQLVHVDIAPLREHGIEAAARKLRHAALDRQPVDFIALAHHRDDQAETVLLQLLRGAGVRGASAMPLIRQRAGYPVQLRPLLNVARSELLVYAQQHALQWVEDESNADDSYPRNFMRHRVLPLLEQRFPAYRETLARSAGHFAEASELLDQLARQDANSFPSPAGGRGGRGEGELFADGGLEVSRLQELSLPRAKNLLRYFLHSLGAPMPQAVQLDGMLQQLCNARQGAAVQLEFGHWQLRRYQGKAYAFPALPEPAVDFCVQWRGEAVLELPELGGTLHFESAIGCGLSLKKLQQARIEVRLRHGAERIRPDGKRPTRTLKNLLQEQAIPPWQRDTLPLLYGDGSLLAVPGIGVDCVFQAEAEEEGVVLKWSAALASCS